MLRSALSPQTSSHPKEADGRLKTWLWSPRLLCRAFLDPPSLEESQPQTVCLSVEGRAESPVAVLGVARLREGEDRKLDVLGAAFQPSP